jgi:hypothetical protein
LTWGYKDVKDSLFEDDEQNTFRLIKYFESNPPLNEILNFNVSTRNHIVKEAIKYEDSKKILDILEKKI